MLLYAFAQTESPFSLVACLTCRHEWRQTKEDTHSLISPPAHLSVHPFIPGSTVSHSVAETICVELEVKPHPL